jgi:hypothetical protein
MNFRAAHISKKVTLAYDRFKLLAPGPKQIISDSRLPRSNVVDIINTVIGLRFLTLKSGLQTRSQIKCRNWALTVTYLRYTLILCPLTIPNALFQEFLPYSSVCTTGFILHPQPVSLRSILIPSSHLCLGLPSGLFRLDFPTKTLYTLPSSHACHMPHSPHSP